MEFTPTGWIAVLRDGAGREIHRPVEGWNGDGKPLVVNETTGWLQHVGTFGGEQLVRLERVGRIVAAVPAAPGWRLKISDSSTEAFSTPIVLWLVDDAGNAVPLNATSDSYLSPAGGQQSSRILSPDETIQDGEGVQRG